MKASAPRHLQQQMPEQAEKRLQYVKFIRSCYQNHPEAFNYYEQLVDYLEPKSDASFFSLQTPELFEVATPDLYPVSSPFSVAEWNGEQQRPWVAILEGFPSPEHIVTLGARWSIRPEFFIGHLFSSCKQTQKSSLYELPTLLSRQENVVHIQCASLVKSLVEGLGSDTSPLRRLEVEKAQTQCQKTLFAEKRYGATRLRNVNAYNSQSYSVEQTISMTVAVNGEKWTAIFLTDQGRKGTMLENHRLPWSSYNDHGRPIGTVTLVPFNALVDGSPRPQESQNKVWVRAADLDKFHPLKNVIVKDKIDMQLLCSDPFFLLCSALTVSALSWAQLLNFMTESIPQYSTVKAEQLNLTLERLRYYIGIIHRIEELLCESLYLIKQGGCSTWPKAAGQELTTRKYHLQMQVQRDYERLQMRCSSLARECESQINQLVSCSQLVAAERGVVQAAQVHKLTRLAAFFIPLGFVATVFGMNVIQMQDQPMWRFIATAIGVSALTLVVMDFWPVCWAWILRHSGTATRSMNFLRQ